MRSGHTVDLVAKLRFDSRLHFKSDAALAAFVRRTLAEPDAVWAWFEMAWFGAAEALRPLLDALATDAREPEGFELFLNGTDLRRWDEYPTDHWFKMMSGSDLMFPGYSDASLEALRRTGEVRRWRRTKPTFWPGVSSEELFVAALLRRGLVLKDVAGVPGVEPRGNQPVRRPA